MAWFSAYSGSSSYNGSGIDISADGRIRMYSGSGQLMDINPNGSMRMSNNGQSMSISSSGYMSMNNNGQHMSISPDGSIGMYNNGGCRGSYCRSSNGGAGRNFVSGQYMGNQGSGQFMQSYCSLPNNTSGTFQSSSSLPVSTRVNITTAVQGNQRSRSPFGMWDRFTNDERDNSGVANRGLSQRDINNMPSFLAEAEKNECCEICLDEVQKGEEIRILPCCHQFHRLCVDPWLKKSSTCPTCRITISLNDFL